MSSIRSLTKPLALLTAVIVSACAPSNAETAASPVQGARRTNDAVASSGSASFDRKGDDGTVVAKVVVPAPLVWDALLAAMTMRNGVAPKLVDRPAGRMGDTALVLMRRYNGEPVSRILFCGTSMTGQRADEERVRAVFLAQLTRLEADTLAIAVHLSGNSTNTSTGGSVANCTSTGHAEADLLNDVVRRLGVVRSR